MDYRDNRFAALAHSANEAHHVETRRRIHERCGLVEQHDGCVLRQHHRHASPLPLPAR